MAASRFVVNVMILAFETTAVTSVILHLRLVNVNAIPQT